MKTRTSSKKLLQEYIDLVKDCSNYTGLILHSKMYETMCRLTRQWAAQGSSCIVQCKKGRPPYRYAYVDSYCVAPYIHKLKGELADVVLEIERIGATVLW